MYYKKAVEHNSAYTLALANLGVCYLKVNNKVEAYYALARAKECVDTDNNNMTPGNKTFVNDQINKFEQEKHIWKPVYRPLKDTYLHFLLCINEDFDEDFLQDIIEVLLEE